jgi:hypothetical protein
MKQSLLNTPTEPFRGAGASLYGSRGPMRQELDYAARKPNSSPPETLSDHIDDAVGKVPGLSARERAAVKAAMTTMCRDIGFCKLIHDQASAHAIPSDQGRLL